MRFALIAEKTDEKTLDIKVGILPDPSCFPVNVTFTNNRISSIRVQDVGLLKKLEDRAEMLHVASSIVDNIAKLIDKNEMDLATSPDKFATIVEERLGRQVVERADGKLVTIGKVKEKAEGVKSYQPIVAGRKVDDKALIVGAESEKEAGKKMQLRFVNAAAEDKKLALLIGTWLADGCKVAEISSDLPLDFIDLHDFK